MMRRIASTKVLDAKAVEPTVLKEPKKCRVHKKQSQLMVHEHRLSQQCNFHLLCGRHTQGVV